MMVGGFVSKRENENELESWKFVLFANGNKRINTVYILFEKLFFVSFYFFLQNKLKIKLKIKLKN